MKRIIYLLCLLWPAILPAQNVIVGPPVAGARFTLNDLLGITLVKAPGTTATHHAVMMQVFRAGAGKVLSVRTAELDLADGATSFVGRQQLLSPLTFLFTAASLNRQMLDAGGYFPDGEYEVQYEWYATGNSGQELLASTGTQVSAAIFPPVLLFQVGDKDTIEQKYPLFTWSGLLDVPQGNDGTGEFAVTYTIGLAELFPGQSVEHAMLYNPKYHIQDNLTTTTFPYPVSARELADSATYAWQVHAVRDKQVLASSEVWSFTYRKKKRKEPQIGIVSMHKEKGYKWTKAQLNRIRFSYVEDYGGGGEQPVECVLLDANGKEVVTGAQTGLKAEKGLNIYELNLCPSGLDLRNGNYLIRLKSLNGEYWFLRFVFELENGCE